MKISFVLVFLLLSFVTITAQPRSSQRPLPVELWYRITPANAGFSVLMPGRPAEQTQPVQSVPGVENHLFTLETGATSYIVSYAQFGRDITDPVAIKQMLDRGRESGLAASGGKLRSEKEIKINEFSGREWVIDLPGGMVATARSYWVKRRLFQQIFIVTPLATDTAEELSSRQADLSKFFGSFELVNKRAAKIH